MGGGDEQVFFLCNHWTEAGIGYAFKKGWYDDRYYKSGFSSVYTIEKMLEAADEYGIVAAMELDVYAYETLEKLAPKTIEKLKSYIKDGKASVEGGTYGQPLGQDYGFESNIRHLYFGKKGIRDIFDYDTKAFLVEEQWFHPQLPQLLDKCEFKYASLQNQNSGQIMPLNETMINWVGIDNTKIPAIPANNIMVSCVRQYGDYGMYRDILEAYEKPLLFQWVEVWVPGMDWGASVTPFEKAIKDAKLMGLKSVSLNTYFDEVRHSLSLRDVFIPYDESNYRNDWYQGGGWGYDGDKVIILNNIAEEKMRNLEFYQAGRLVNGKRISSRKQLSDLWKRLLILQNHDTSVARSYRAQTGSLITNANSLVLDSYEKLIDELHEAGANDMVLEIGINRIYFPLNIRNVVTHAFTVATSEPLEVYLDDKIIPGSQTIMDGQSEIIVNIDAEPFRIYEIDLRIAGKKTENSIGKSGTFICNNIEVTHTQGWSVEIRNLSDDTLVTYEAFSGGIYKANEHNELFHSLSPAHLQFTFQFDGTKHCPDQTSSMHVRCLGVSENAVYKSLLLEATLLSLHTTDTPVCIARSEVTVNKVSGIVGAHSYLYTGVYLGFDAYSKFTVNYRNPSVFRDYPFYEEEAKINEFCSLSYVRVAEESRGLTILNSGNQRVVREGNTFKYKIMKDKLLFDYTFNFTIKFSTSTPIDSYNLKDLMRTLPIKSEHALKVEKRYDDTIITQCFTHDDKVAVRIVNYSDKGKHEKINFGVAVKAYEIKPLLLELNT